MNENPTKQDVLEVARQGVTAYLRVLGRATFQDGPVLKQFGASAIEEGCTLVVLDVSACEGMDSTFMGVLAGIAMRLARHSGGKMRMLNVSEKLFEVLSTLGLNQVIECRRLGAVPEPLVAPPLTPRALRPIDAASADRQTTQDVMLEAHKTLSDVSSANKLRFKDVLTYLRDAGKRSSRDGYKAQAEPP